MLDIKLRYNKEMW